MSHGGPFQPDRSVKARPGAVPGITAQLRLLYSVLLNSLPGLHSP